jgi:tripartite-type tricarboxylate transporter receptor subunit TctC
MKDGDAGPRPDEPGRSEAPLRKHHRASVSQGRSEGGSNMLKALIFAASAAVIGSALSPQGALALDKPGGFPERPVTIIVPYGAGGGSDQLSRAMASALEKVMGVGVQVVNKPGGGGMAAVPDFMNAPKDGYTILETIDNSVSNFVSGKLKENPGKDWVPLCMAQITFSQIYVRPDDSRFPDWKAFVAYAKANPGKLTIANVGNIGSMERVNMLKIERALGFKTNQIAFDKPAERYAALIGAQVDALFEQPGDVRSFLDAGQMKPILTVFDRRPAAFADVPTVKDVGADFEPLLRFRGFYTHPDVPKERQAYLEAACKEAFNSDRFQAFNKSKYMHLIDSYRDTAGSRKLIDGAIATYRAVYKEMGLIK